MALRFVTILLMLLCSTSIVSGATVFRWVDDAGVTHFSDAPPVGQNITTDTLQIADELSSDKQGEDYYSVTNQWRRMREEREAKEKLSIERAKHRATEQIAYSEPYAEQPTPYYPIYTAPYGYGRPPYGHVGRGRDRHHNAQPTYGDRRFRNNNVNIAPRRPFAGRNALGRTSPRHTGGRGGRGPHAGFHRGGGFSASINLR